MSQHLTLQAALGVASTDIERLRKERDVSKHQVAALRRSPLMRAREVSCGFPWCDNLQV